MATLPELLKSTVELGGSDLHLTTNTPPQVRVHGHLQTLDLPVLGPSETKALAYSVLTDAQKKRFEETLELDFSFGLKGLARFRCNMFNQRGSVGAVYRLIPEEIKSFQDLALPPVLATLADRPRGLVLVTGPTGSGKSTTLAAILNQINSSKAVHIVTLEDPVEYLHKHQKATFNQRELGVDFDSYSNGLRAALRQAPKVILVGEMRDRDTIKIALSAAETGHLVLSTLHTVNAGETVNRILGMFEPDEQEQVRIRLSDSLRWVASQRLVPKISGGRYALVELMGANLRTQETIRLGESEGKTFYEIIEASYPFGWRTFDNACLDAYEQGIITEETALLYCTKRSVVSRGIDNLKKMRGEMSNTAGLLRMKAGLAAANAENPPVLKIK